MKRRTLALLLALAMAFALVSCGSGNASTGTPDSSNPPAASTADEGGDAAEPSGEGRSFKIGYNQFATGDFALESLAANTQNGIEGLGCEAMGVIAGGSLEQTITDVENMITAGCDGLVLWLPIDSLYLTVAEMCEEAGVYWTLADKVTTDEDLLAQLYTYEYFAGGVAPDNYSYGVALAEYAIEQGYTSTYILAPGVGDGTATPRIEGFSATFEAAGGTILGEAHTDDSNEAVTQAEDMYLAYGSDADCIFCTGSATFGTAALTILQKYNDHDLKILTGDLDQTILTSMAEDDYVAVCAGDFWVAGTLASVMCVNALEGNMWVDENGNAATLTDVPSFGVPAEQLDLFNNYIIGNALYSDEELEAMVGGSWQNFADTVHSYSLVERFQAKYAQGIISADELAAAGIEAN